MISHVPARTLLRRGTEVALVVVAAAVGLACGGDTTADTDDTEVVAVRGDDACAVVGAVELASLLDMSTPEVIQGGDDVCLFAFPGDATTLGSILRAGAELGQGMLDSIAEYDDEAIEVFGVQRITDIDEVEGTFGPVGFVAVVDDRVTYQFAIDGPEADRSEAMLRLVRALAARESARAD